MVDCRLHTLRANDVEESTYALPERTKRGLPTNKNISVRNMKAQIANMSLNENAGFKCECQVQNIFVLICLNLFTFALFNPKFVDTIAYMFYVNTCNITGHTSR